MMFPTVVPADVSGVFALLAALADPELVRQRLDELQAESKKAAEDRAAATALQKDIDAKHAQTTSLVEEARILDARNTKEHAQRSHDLDARETLLNQHQAELDAALKEFTKLRADHLDAADERTQALDLREEELAAGEAQLNDDRTKFDADRADLDARLAKLRALAG